MYIIKVTWRHKNDFHFVAFCQWCGQKSQWGDGYADAYYQQEVFPNRKCPHCDRTELNLETAKETSAQETAQTEN